VGGILHAQESVNSGSAIGIREFTARFLKTRLSVIDAIVGAVALARATPLCTFNTRHYKEFNLELCQPYFTVHTP
jgi:predicted nucleic acid-binding protein